MSVSASVEIDWVLRSAREFAQDPALRTQSSIARGGDNLPAVDKAQISRWESGRLPLEYHRVRRYEQTLGLPDHQLLCLIEQIHRDREPVRHQPMVAIPRPADLGMRVEELLERALSASVMKGVDWDELTSLCATNPEVILRRTDRLALLEQCLGELDLSVGLEYALRLEALARMASSPRSSDLIVAYVGDVLRDPHRAFYAEAAALLQYSPGRTATALLVDTMQDPANESIWRWAASTLASKLQHGHRLDPVRHRIALHEALAILPDRALGFPTHAAAAALIHAMGDGPRIAGLLDRAVEAAGRRTLVTGRILVSEQQQRIVRRVQEAIQEEHGPDMPDIRVLNRLLVDLTGVESKERGHALAILVLSPYGRYVGDAYFEELQDSLATNDIPLAHDALAVLRSLVQPAHAATLVGYLHRTDLPPSLLESIALAVGNRPAADVSAGVDRSVFTAALEQMQTTDDQPVARGMTYALGMRNQRQLLTALEQQATSTVWRRYALWWLNQADA